MSQAKSLRNTVLIADKQHGMLNRREKDTVHEKLSSL